MRQTEEISEIPQDRLKAAAAPARGDEIDRSAQPVTNHQRFTTISRKRK
jgi:hypothetical protein